MSKDKRSGGCRGLFRRTGFFLFIFFCIIPLAIGLFQEATGIVILPTRTPSPTPTATIVVAQISTVEIVVTPTATNTPPPTETSTYTAVPTNTSTSEPTETATNTPLPTATSTITNTPIPISTNTLVPTQTIAAEQPVSNSEDTATMKFMMETVTGLDIEAIDIHYNDVIGERSIVIGYLSSASDEAGLLSEWGSIFGGISSLDRNMNLDIDVITIIVGNESGLTVGIVAADINDVHAFVDGEISAATLVARLTVDSFVGN